ncbi:TetR/AcrR family transcriptional regulator [Nonomuraea sp. NN258]|uniref:TetR/AcrR family transcriptional regulator C-terminal domain-containing protein n=1 Tax=Nonomuraea antri TaxID=2730852 RepID=UPI001568EB92|nr:TetR/AcrR family transcriptional regulator C-terminal domain-containing protein [Nonomuraea antri]NRQ36350.1 TetR/AcrR family transcriptional regulator [Nonomuraea antri]
MTVEYSGKGDPARSLALLWRTSERASRKGKPELNVDRIARAAIAVADAEGLQALSMRRVAEKLGVGTMSLYTYVPGKPELLDVMLDTVYGETARPDEVEGGWRTRLEQIARENWALYLRHPWLLQVAASRPVLGPNVTAKYDYELRAIDGIGLSDVEMDAVLTLVTGFVHGTARGAVEAAQAESQTGMSDEQWWAAHAPFLSRIADTSRFPTAARVGEAAGQALGGAYSAEHAFEFGLQRVLDGIQALVDDRDRDA